MKIWAVRNADEEYGATGVYYYPQQRFDLFGTEPQRRSGFFRTASALTPHIHGERSHMYMSYDLIVIMPIYNEEGCIADVLNSWIAILSGLDINYLIFALNDGSTDATAEALSAFTGDSHVDVVNKTNSGHGPTILMGYRKAVTQAQWVFQCDSDNEMKAGHFPALWARRRDYDALFGFRAGRKQNAGRWLISFCSRTIVKLFFGRGVHDANTPYRLMRSSLLSKAIETIPENTFAPNVIISGAFAKSGARIYNMPVPHERRQTGIVSIVRWKLWKSAWTALWQTLHCRPKIDLK